MLETITAVNQAVNSFIWGIPAMVCIIGVGLLLSVRTGFLQIRKFPYAIRTTIGRIFRRKDASDGAMTPFQAVCTALAATVGTGNIAGVAGAIAIGGPGAVFWMWCSALLGMCTKFSEVTLAVNFRERNKNGELVGGPMYYIKNGLGSRWQFLAVLYSLFGVLTVFGTGNATQVNTIVTAIDSALLAYGSSLNSILPTVNLVVGVVVAMMVAMVLLGGVKRIGSVTEKLVPFMALFYVVLALGVVLFNLGRLLEVLELIVADAFGWGPALGGAVGAALMQGIKRGLFSNEAGMGSAPNVAATAHVSHPVKQGLIQTLGVFTDTLVICTCTAFIILFGGIPDASLNGIQLTQAALVSEIGPAGGIFVAVAIFLFAFSSIIGNYYYGEANIRFITPRPWVLTLYRLLVGAMVLFGALATLDLAWSLADVTMALMTLCNLAAIVLLGRQAFLLLADYTSQKRQGIKNPVFTKDRIPELKNKIECW